MTMKKIIKLCLVGVLAVTLMACGSSDEKKAKAVVSDTLDTIQSLDLKEIAALTNEEYDSSWESNDVIKRTAKIMFDRLDYKITDVSVNDNEAAVTVDISNINYTTFIDETKRMLYAENENFDDLSLEEKEAKSLEVQERQLSEADLVTRTITAYVVKDGDTWKLANQNANLFKATVGQ